MRILAKDGLTGRVLGIRVVIENARRNLAIRRYRDVPLKTVVLPGSCAVHVGDPCQNKFVACPSDTYGLDIPKPEKWHFRLVDRGDRHHALIGRSAQDRDPLSIWDIATSSTAGSRPKAEADGGAAIAGVTAPSNAARVTPANLRILATLNCSPSTRSLSEAAR